MAQGPEATAERPPTAIFEPHGVPGTHGRPFAPIHRAFDQDAFGDAFWVADPPREDDLHVAFVADLVLRAATRFALDSQASSVYRIWADGELVVDGPLRFAPAVPEFDRRVLDLSAGEHRIAVRAIGEGLTTRAAAPVPAFIWVRLAQDDGPIELEWRGRVLDEMRPTGLESAHSWAGWSGSPTPLSTTGAWIARPRSTGHPSPVVHTPVQRWEWEAPTDAPLAMPVPLRMKPSAHGRFRDTYTGYEFDDPVVQFLLADATPGPDDDIDGSWMRYDLGRIRIGRVELTVNCDRPAEVLIAYADRLTPDGRPAPVAALSAGPTRFLQRFTVPDGSSRIEPMQSLGARYVEVRVRTRGHAAIVDETFVERDHLGEPMGAFHSGDPLLDRIWMVGLDTLRASAEDFLVDSVRERGEWIGDVVTAGLPLLTAAGDAPTSFAEPSCTQRRQLGRMGSCPAAGRGAHLSRNLRRPMAGRLSRGRRNGGFDGPAARAGRCRPGQRAGADRVSWSRWAPFASVEFRRLGISGPL